MSMRPEIGVAQNMIQVPPNNGSGVGHFLMAPFQGCFTVITVVVLLFCYSCYKFAHWTHEMAVDRAGNRIVNAAKPVLSTRPIAVVIKENLFDGDAHSDRIQHFDSRPAIKVLRLGRYEIGPNITVSTPANPNSTPVKVREELVEAKSGSPARYLIRTVSENYKPVYDDDYKVVNHEHESYTNYYEYLYVFEGDDALKQADHWLEANRQIVKGCISNFDPLEMIDHLRPESVEYESPERAVTADCYYKYEGKWYYDTNGREFGELTTKDVAFLSNFIGK